MADPGERRRLEALHSYRILDTGRESAYDELARLAALVCDAPMAVLSFVDADRQWFKAAVGLSASETARSMAFCAHAIEHDGPLIVEDARADARFADNPMVVDEPGVRCYAGVPLVTPDGARLGALAVLDNAPRRLTVEQVALLSALSRQVMALLELRLRHLERQSAAERVDEWLARGAVGSWRLLSAFRGRPRGIRADPGGRCRPHPPR